MTRSLVPQWCQCWYIIVNSLSPTWETRELSLPQLMLIISSRLANCPTTRHPIDKMSGIESQHKGNVECAQQLNYMKIDQRMKPPGKMTGRALIRPVYGLLSQQNQTIG